jgi:hypothetical protein
MVSYQPLVFVLCLLHLLCSLVWYVCMNDKRKFGMSVGKRKTSIARNERVDESIAAIDNQV